MKSEKKKLISWLLVATMTMGIIPPYAISAKEQVQHQLTQENPLTDTEEEILGQSEQESEPIIKNPFTDVSEDDWFYHSVMYSFEEGLFAGTGETTFSPNGQVSRGMFVTVLGRMANIDPSAYTNNSFEDVKPEAYYTPYVNWAAEVGMTSGVSEKQFAPDGMLTREQLAAFIINYFKYLGYVYSEEAYTDTIPNDYDKLADWAKESVMKLWKLGIIRGDQNGNFNGKQIASRAEAATFIMRIDKELKSQGLDPEQDKDHLEETLPEDTLLEEEKSEDHKNDSSSSGSSSNKDRKVTVSFDTKGGGTLDSIRVTAGKKITDLPVPRKENAIFLGWYEDESFLNEVFTEETVVNKNITLYAKYIHIEQQTEEIKDDTFTITGGLPSLEIELVDTTGKLSLEEVLKRIKLEAVDGSTVSVDGKVDEDVLEYITLHMEQEGSRFIVSAKEGFLEGGSYRLELLDEALEFDGQEATIRKLTFTIDKEEIFNLELNQDLIYIPADDVRGIIKDGVEVETFSAPIVAMGYSDNIEETNGHFIYLGDEVLEKGDTLSIYSGDKPEKGDDEGYLDDDIAYLEVVKVDGETIYYEEAKAENVLFLPEVLPLSQNDITFDPQDETTFTIEVAIDFSDATYEAFGLDETTTFDVDDYIVLYEGDDLEDAEASKVIYGKITNIKVDANVRTITFKEMTFEEVEEELTAHEFYSKNELDGDQLLKDMDVAELEKEIEQQVRESGFDDQLAEQLATYALGTEGIQDLAGESFNSETMTFTLADGEQVDIETFQQMMRGQRNSNITVGIPKVDVKLSGYTKYFGRGVSADIGISVDITIQTTDKSAIVITVGANFTQEIKVDLNTSAKAIWGKKWIFPYIRDYDVKVNIDLYNYTGFGFNVVATLNEYKAPEPGKEPEEEKKKVDVTVEIQDLLSNTDDEEIKEDLESLFDLYSELTSTKTGWIEVVRTNLFTSEYSLLYGVIHIRIKADLVISAELMVVLGIEFEYITAERYNFWVGVFSQTAGSTTTQLMDEQYRFQFYVLGSLGIRAGIELEIFIGIISVDFNSIGVGAQTGIYARLSGFYFYEYRFRAGSGVGTSEGALYFELGAYLTIYFRAQILDGKYEYKPTLFEDEWPLLSAGMKNYVYDFAYDTSDFIHLVKDQTIMTLPSDLFFMKSVDLVNGDMEEVIYNSDYFDMTIESDFFAVHDGKIYVYPPEHSDLAEAEMTIRWKTAPLAFSSVPLEKTFQVMWSDLDENGYSIVFDAQEGSMVQPIIAPYGTPIKAPVHPVRLGYTFDGWYLEPEGMTEYTVPAMMAATNVTVYAKWRENTNTPYTVEHHQQNIGNEEYTLFEEQVFVGTTGEVVSPEAKQYEGFKSPRQQQVVIEADGSATVIYYYERESYFINYYLGYHLGAGEERIVEEYKYGAKVSVPLVIRDGYRFTGWTGTVAIPDTMPGKNLTYKATWVTGKEEGTYTVEHYQENLEGDYILVDTITETVSALETITVPVKDYEGFTAPEVQTIELLPNEEKVVRYEYKRNAYTITYKALNFGSTTPEPQIYKYGQTIELLAPDHEGVYELFGQTYVGWTEAITSGKLFTETVMPAKDITLELLPEVFEGKTGYLMKVYRENIERLGEYDFLGYIYKEAQVGDSITINETMIPATSALGDRYALANPTQITITEANTVQMIDVYYDVKTYLIHFDAEGNTALEGKMPAPLEVPNYGVSMLPDISKEVPSFKGWQIKLASGEYVIFDFEAFYAGEYGEILVGEDITLYPNIVTLEDQRVTVRHARQNLEDEAYTLYEITYMDVVAGTVEIEIPVQTYEGFTSPEVIVLDISYDEENIVEYNYTRNSYTITYAKYNTLMHMPSPQSFKYGEPITVVPMEHVGVEDAFEQTFIGWTEDITGGKLFDTVEMPANDITLYLLAEVYEGKTGYIIQLYMEDEAGNYLAGGHIFQEAEVGEVINLDEDQLQLPIYITADYKLSNPQEITITDANKAQVVELYYDYKTYTITFDANGIAELEGKMPTPLTVKYWQIVQLPDLSDELSTFEGWKIIKDDSVAYPYDQPFQFSLFYDGYYEGYWIGDDIILYPRVTVSIEGEIPTEDEIPTENEVPSEEGTDEAVTEGDEVESEDTTTDTETEAPETPETPETPEIPEVPEVPETDVPTEDELPTENEAPSEEGSGEMVTEDDEVESEDTTTNTESETTNSEEVSTESEVLEEEQAPESSDDESAVVETL